MFRVFFGYWDPISTFPRTSFELLLYKRVKIKRILISVFPIIFEMGGISVRDLSSSVSLPQPTAILRARRLYGA